MLSIRMSPKCGLRIPSHDRRDPVYHVDQPPRRNSEYEYHQSENSEYNGKDRDTRMRNDMFFRCLTHIHRHNYPEVVVKRNYGHEDCDDDNLQVTGLDTHLKDIELGEEARRGRYACQ